VGEMLSSWLGREGFLPHGYCFTWSPGLLWSMVGADAVIAASYYSIPLALLHFARRRPDVQFKGVLWLFCAFIFACGTTHLLAIWTIWQPDYAVETVAKLLTAAVSLLTAIALWPLIPRALRIPTVTQLQAAIATLDAEVGRRKTAEEHLAETQQSLALTLASIDAGFIATDRLGRVARMNAVAERVTGWSQAEALGHVLWEVFQREGRPVAFFRMNPVDVMIEQGVTIEDIHQIECIGRDGTRTSLEVRSTLMHAADGEARGMAVVFRDMTQLMRAQAESARLAAIVESSHDAIIGSSLDGLITSWNAAATSLYGHSAEEAIGQPLSMLIPPGRQAEEMHLLAAVAAGERVPAFDTTRRARDGQLIDVSLTVSPIRDANGRVIGASKIARDISEARRIQQALRQSAARLRFTLEAGQIGDWELDLTSGAMKVSPTLERCFGQHPSHGAWTLDALIARLHPDDREAVRLEHRAAIDGGRDWSFESRVVWPDGSLHWVHAIGRVPPEAEAPARMLGIVMDVTQQKLAEQARLKAQSLEAENLQILESSRLKSEFLANMSHELRTPLNSVIGFADLLHADKVPEGSPKRKVFVDHIRTSGRHLLQLINDILDLSKVEAGKFEFFPEPVSLPVLTGEVVDALAEQARAKAIGVSVVIAPEVAGVVIDAQRLRQILFNYLSNALKFTPQGGKVIVRATVEDGHFWRLEVEDSGIGIRPEDIGRLFTEFQQLEGGLTKQHAGTGLGLALTRRLVEAQGGSVGVRSVPGQFTVFHAVLPRNANARTAGMPTSARRALPRADEGRADAPRASKLVLVVDDDPLSRELMSSLLSSASYAVSAHSDPAVALALLESNRPAAVILDLAMPGYDGFEFLERLRALPTARDTPVFVWTVLDLGAHDRARLAGKVVAIFRKSRTDNEAVLERIRLHLEPH